MAWSDYVVEHTPRNTYMTQRGLVYLMAPYSSVKDKARLMQAVYQLACQYMKEHPHTQVVSPLFYHYAVGVVPGIEGDWDFWEDYSIGLMRKCDSAIMLQWEDGGVEYWKTSKGIHEETRLLASMQIPIVARFSPELKLVG